MTIAPARCPDHSGCGTDGNPFIAEPRALRATSPPTAAAGSGPRYLLGSEVSVAMEPVAPH